MTTTGPGTSELQINHAPFVIAALAAAREKFGPTTDENRYDVIHFVRRQVFELSGKPENRFEPTKVPLKMFDDEVPF